MQSAAARIDEIAELFDYMTDEEKSEISAIMEKSLPMWVPLPGPQTNAFESKADIIYYGGSAGGGKSDLLLGLALTQHKHSIIYRRQSTQLIGIQSRLLDEILKSRKGWNGQDDILTLADRKLEFGSCNNSGEEIKYQGRPHDFCVAEGTAVLMSDGNYRPIETIKTGDTVATLEGPCRVSLGSRSRSDKAVLVSASNKGGLIGRQVQGVGHSLLTTAGWVSHDSASAFHRSLVSLRIPILRHFLHNIAEWIQHRHQGFLQPRELILKDFLHSLKFHLPFLGQSQQEFSFAGGALDLGIGSEVFGYQPLRDAQHFSKNVPQAPKQPYHDQFLLNYFGEESRRVTVGDRAYSTLLNFADYCLTYFRQDDERVRPFGEAGLKGLLLQACAGKPIPKGFVNGGQGKTHEHTLRKESYDHPYTMEKRQILADTLAVSLSYSPINNIKLFDITVSNANHYITDGGFVNKNCGFDEITHFLESQFRFLIGWLRTTTPGQRCRIVCAGNPPTTTDGQWVVSFWAPWLDDKHPDPALPGELRWFTTIDGKDQECSSGDAIIINGKKIQPISRTFISSRVTDNPFLMKTGYEATLQSLPEPLRSQMLNGDFKAGMEDSAWQVIPTAWIDAAMDRWTPEGKKGLMDSVGADVARGGSDKTTCSVRYGYWYDKIKTWPGSQTPTGAAAAGLIVSCIRDQAPVHVDALGVGGETVGHLESAGIQTIAVSGYDTKRCDIERDKATGKLKFRNLRAMMFWRFRESLDPVTGLNVSLPPDPELKADLCCAMWKLTPGGILIEQKEDIKKRIGRSPDKGDAVLYCSLVTPKRNRFRNRNTEVAEEWSPFDD